MRARDFYGTQHYASSSIFEPMGYALGNLFNTVKVFDPPSTSAAEVRAVPVEHLYFKSMVLAGDPEPFAHNKTGFVPQLRGNAVGLWEIGFTPGTTASSVRAFDDVQSRKGYSGLYRFGLAYNPGHFSEPGDTSTHHGNVLLYWMANHAVWRADSTGKGLDATASYDWSPRSINRNYSQWTAGLRFNERQPRGWSGVLSRECSRRSTVMVHADARERGGHRLGHDEPRDRASNGPEMRPSSSRFRAAALIRSCGVDGWRGVGSRHAACLAQSPARSGARSRARSPA